ncbi:carbonate dehydratase [Simiduia aestuariiviva]|uniref:Carbonic anhydrase n=1 Tax=Simiduia aestuariiviva TaxID=1510459 RepID=A0A839UVK2_9GAMM|nr:carbonate dehydratase [Simiduia aestuariiviva]MBB3169365.1 carbonic anhydrase [Simiduia aestuariiviva]
MTKLANLFENNQSWAEAIKAEDPEFFAKLSKQQDPDFLWIGCSDSRVPANDIVGLMPGELFVHRNVANVVLHTDLNCLSVIQYAVDVLKVDHIMVVGHYGCGGVAAALQNQQLGVIDLWIRNIRDIYYANREQIDALPDQKARVDRLCELNVMQQVQQVSRTNVVQNAWARGQKLSVHGWIYGVSDGLLKDLIDPITGVEQIPEQYRVLKITQPVTSS